MLIVARAWKILFVLFWNFLEFGRYGVFSIKAGWICTCESKGYDRLPTVQDLSVKATTDWNRPLLLGLLVTTCLSYLTTGAPGKERGTNKLPLTGRIRERSKAEKRCLSICPTNLPEFFLLHPSWLSNACDTKKDPESEQLAKDNPETNLITIKPETASHVAEQFSWVLLPYCSPPGYLFPIKSLALSAHVCTRTIHC